MLEVFSFGKTSTSRSTVFDNIFKPDERYRSFELNFMIIILQKIIFFTKLRRLETK